MKYLATALCVGAMMMAAPAGAQEFRESTIVKFLDAESAMKPVMDEIGATYTDMDGDTGGKRIVFSNGLITYAEFRVCSNGNSNCEGMRLLASYGAPEGVSRTELMRRANEFNSLYNTAKVVVRDDGSVYYTRYLISDGGISMENYRVGLSVFQNMREPFETIVLEGGSTE